MFAFVSLMILLLTIPVTVFEVFEEQDLQQDAATTITSRGRAARTASEEPCVSPPPQDPSQQDTGSNPPPSDDTGSNPPPSDDTPSDTSDDPQNSDTPEDDTDETDEPSTDEKKPREKRARGRNIFREVQRLQKEIRKRIGLERPSNELNIPAPRPPNIPKDEFPFNGESPLVGKIERSQEIKVRPRRPNITVPTVSIPTISPARDANKSGIPDAKELQQRVKDRLKNTRTRVQQAEEDCVPRTITIKTVDKRGGAIASAGVLLNSGNDGNCTTNTRGTCGITVYRSGEFRVFASKLINRQYVHNEQTITVGDKDSNATIALVNQSTTKPSPDPSSQKLDVKLHVVANIGTGSISVPGTTIRILQNGKLITSDESDEDGWVYFTLPEGTYQLEALNPDYIPHRSDLIVKSGEPVTKEGKLVVIDPQKSDPANPPSRSIKRYIIIPTVYNVDTGERPSKGTTISASQNGHTIDSCTLDKYPTCELELPKGTYLITANHPDYELYSTKYEVTGGKERTLLTVNLKPKSNNSGPR